MDEATTTTQPRFRRRALSPAGPMRDPACCTRCSAAARENDRLRNELRTRRLELAGAAARVVEAADAERRRLERDLHDGAQQRLLAIALELRLLALRSTPDAQTSRALARAQDELAASMRELRDLAHGLHPAVLSDHGLAVALHSLAARAPLPVRLVVRLDERPPAPVEIAVYYLVSEALTNIAKYAEAGAARVEVFLERDQIVVEVADDGVGGADPRAGSGLRGLEDRVRANGGRLTVTSPPGRGTTIRATVPRLTPAPSQGEIRLPGAGGAAALR